MLWLALAKTKLFIPEGSGKGYESTKKCAIVREHPPVS
jgi:hypothetical protein